MQIDSCEFPDGLLYDEDGLQWARIESDGDALVGITSIHAAIAGRPAKITAKPVGQTYGRGRTIATLDSPKFFGPIRAPIGGVLQEINAAVLARPRLVTDALYGDGWIARLRPTNLAADRQALGTAEAAKDRLSDQIRALHVRCFAAFPDHDLIEIGTECAAVLTKLDDLIGRIEPGDVVHLVSDDPTAPIEMVRWSDRANQPVLETRKEGALYHFLVRKTS
ncbi:MAG TPA: hypothetical protein VEO96_06200 [Thermoplasmata archaeon]|nr:hypothetical protein [Thermoplasmata archaeon]